MVKAGAIGQVVTSKCVTDLVKDKEIKDINTRRLPENVTQATSVCPPG